MRVEIDTGAVVGRCRPERGAIPRHSVRGPPARRVAFPATRARAGDGPAIEWQSIPRRRRSRTKPSASACAARPSCSEDCLYLNVFAPGARAAQLRPVFVWIYGGGYLHGDGADPLFDGSNLARSQDLVVVTINYRLGLWGFAPLVERNVGLADQIAALRVGGRATSARSAAIPAT